MDNRMYGLAALAALLPALWPCPCAAQEPAQEPGQEQEAAPPGYEELTERIEELERQVEELRSQSEAAAEEAELEALLAAADEEIAAGEDDAAQGGADPEDEVFQSGARALQALNPEISITGDVLGKLYINRNFYIDPGEEHSHDGHVHGGIERSGFEMRAFELAFQANLDPFSFAKFILAFHHGAFELEEGYVTWAGAIPRVSITLGRFQQQLGVLNRWHEHALDQVDRPLTHLKYLGGHGLNATGVSVRIMIPRAWAHAEELTIEIANGSNESLFAGEFFSIPTVLGHLKSFWDLGPSTYMELGLSGVWGLNNRWGWMDESVEELVNEDRRHTVLAGADLSLVWIPAGREKYRGLAWRTEFFYLHKDVETAEGIETLDSFGGYTYLDLKAGAVVSLGVRFDIGQEPDVHGDGWYWQTSPYMTFWQSEFVYFRLQYSTTYESTRGFPIHSVLFQADFSAGPHKHEKY